MPAAPDATSGSQRPVVALIKVVATPYWLHLHRRIDREIPEIELHCLYLFDVGDQPWVLTEKDVRPVNFASPGEQDADKPLKTVKQDWDKASRVIAWLREHDAKFAVVGGYHNVTAPRIARWCRRHRIPAFLTGDSNIHADRAVGVKKHVKSTVIRWMIRQCAGVMPFGTAGKNLYLKYGADPAKVFYFPGEPNYRIIEDLTSDETKAVAAKFSLATDRKRLLFCGRLIPVKRVDLLVDAFVSLAESRPEWDLVILGDGPLAAELKARVPEALRSRVTWTGFVADQKVIAGVYQSCDVLVLPSDHEPWALVVNEALAAGLAVVTSDVVGAADDLVRPGVNGYTFPRGDLSALKRCLGDVTSPDNIAKMKAASKVVIADWRQRGDPVAGLRRALEFAGVIPPRRS